MTASEALGKGGPLQTEVLDRAEIGFSPDVVLKSPTLLDAARRRVQQFSGWAGDLANHRVGKIPLWVVSLGTTLAALSALAPTLMGVDVSKPVRLAGDFLGSRSEIVKEMWNEGQARQDFNLPKFKIAKAAPNSPSKTRSGAVEQSGLVQQSKEATLKEELAGLPEDTLTREELQRLHINIVQVVDPQTGKPDTEVFLRKKALERNPLFQQAAYAAENLQAVSNNPPYEVNILLVPTTNLLNQDYQIPPGYEGVFNQAINQYRMAGAVGLDGFQAHTLNVGAPIIDKLTGRKYFGPAAVHNVFNIVLATGALGNQSYLTPEDLTPVSPDQATSHEYWERNGQVYSGDRQKYAKFDEEKRRTLEATVVHELSHPGKPLAYEGEVSNEDGTIDLSERPLAEVGYRQLGNVGEIDADIGLYTHLQKASQLRQQTGDDSEYWLVVRKTNPDGSTQLFFGGIAPLLGAPVEAWRRKRHKLAA